MRRAWGLIVITAVASVGAALVASLGAVGPSRTGLQVDGQQLVSLVACRSRGAEREPARSSSPNKGWRPKLMGATDPFGTASANSMQRRRLEPESAAGAAT